MIPEELLDSINFENLIWSCDENCIDDVKELLSKINNNYYAQKVINHVSNFRIFGFKFLGDAMAETGEIIIDNINNEFAAYLYKRGILDKEKFAQKNQTFSGDNKDLIEFEYPIPKGSVWEYIYHDDVNGFVCYIETNQVKISSLNVNINMHFFNINCFVLFCGALNVMKYLELNGNKIDSLIYYYAIEGGNEEMLEYLSSKGHSFKNEIGTAILYHHNDIASWIIDEVEQTDIKLADCVFNNDTEMFFKFFENGSDVNEFGRYDKTALMIAAIHNDIRLVDFLLSNGADPSIKDAEGSTAFDLAATKELKDLLQMHKQ